MVELMVVHVATMYVVVVGQVWWFGVLSLMSLFATVGLGCCIDSLAPVVIRGFHVGVSAERHQLCEGVGEQQLPLQYTPTCRIKT
jgi:hypothetical protein